MKPWDSIELTEKEKEEALIECRKKKFYHEKSLAYWDRQRALIEPQKKTKRTAGFKMV